MATTMQQANNLRRILEEGKASMGMWQMLPGSNVSRTLARTGVDWICVDGEHGNIDGKEACSYFQSLYEGLQYLARSEKRYSVQYSSPVSRSMLVSIGIEEGFEGFLISLYGLVDYP
jgi:2-keto-3-deoxy-L-rhamnonate aldolase RhmA